MWGDVCLHVVRAVVTSHLAPWPMATVSKMSKAIWVIAYFWHLVPRRIAVIQCTVMVRNIAKLAAASTARKSLNCLAPTLTFNVGSRA